MPEATVTDLPGIYSCRPIPARRSSPGLPAEHPPDGIINIVDATNIERNLYLTMQLMELEIPMVLALNMMDEVRANGGTIMVNELEELLGVPVVPISAAKNEGIDELVEHAPACGPPPRGPRPHRFLRCHRWQGRRGTPLHPRRGPPD